MEVAVIFVLKVFCFAALPADKDVLTAFNERDIFVKRFLYSKNILDFPLAEVSQYS